MQQPQIFEGKWEDILLRNSAQLSGQWVKVSVESKNYDSTNKKILPNTQALAMLRELSKLHESMNETDPSQTDRLIREARSGGMYGIVPTE